LAVAHLGFAELASRAAPRPECDPARLHTSFHTEVLVGWQQAVGEELGGRLPCWAIPRAPLYPRPGEHA